MKTLQTIIFTCLAFLLFFSGIKYTSPRRLFNGKNLNNWEKFLGPAFPGHEDAAKGAAPDNVFSVVELNGEKVIRISGEVHGSLATKDSFQNYHLRLVFKWGEAITKERNSGLLYNSYGALGTAYGTWMASLECQLMHGNLGDGYLMVDEVECASTVKYDSATNQYFYTPSGEKTMFGQQFKRRMIKKFADYEKPLGEWNTVDLYCLGDKAMQFVNGNLTLANENISINRNGQTISLTSGRIQLQSEGAELFVKSVTVETVKKMPDKSPPN